MTLYQEVRSSHVANLIEKIPDVHIVFQHSYKYRLISSMVEHPLRVEEG